MVEFVKSEVYCNMDELPMMVKVAGLAKFVGVTHDGTCGFRCIAAQIGVSMEDMVQRFIDLKNEEMISDRKVHSE
jgi:hypothetical protein